MTQAPTVSVVMAAYRGTALIPDTMRSLLAQRFTDFELVVVDDCSGDGTPDLLRSFGDPRIRVFESERNGGPVLARNRAFAEAQGRYIAGLDQDDLCHPERFARQVAALDADPGTVLVATHYDVLESGRTRPGPAPDVMPPALIDWVMHFRNPLAWSSVMMRGDVARGLLPFTRPEVLYAEDFDLYQRLRPHGRIARIDMPLTTYRLHAGGVSKQFAARMRSSTAIVLAKAYHGISGIEPVDIAELVARHVALGEPVGCRAVLARLTAAMARISDHAIAAIDPSPEDRALIDAELSRSWWRMARAAVRSGGLARRDVIAERPGIASPAPASGADMLISSLIGRGRVMRRRFGRPAQS